LSDPGCEKKDGRLFRNRVEPDEDGGVAARTLGIRAGYQRRKWLNENLAPLRRWLSAQAGRQWNDVYSEIASGIDRRNPVQQHIFEHIGQYVALHGLVVDGTFLVRDHWPNKYVPVAESRFLLYVDHRSGVLCTNVERKTNRQRKLERLAKAQRAKRRIIGPREQLHFVEGIWYRVALARVVASARGDGDAYLPWDALIHEKAGHRNSEQRKLLYGDGELYAKSKKQLSRKELLMLKLDQQAGSTRPVFFDVDITHAPDRTTGTYTGGPWLGPE